MNNFAAWPLAGFPFQSGLKAEARAKSRRFGILCVVFLSDFLQIRFIKPRFLSKDGH
jgi:hypothetical protein